MDKLKMSKTKQEKFKQAMIKWFKKTIFLQKVQKKKPLNL